MLPSCSGATAGLRISSSASCNAQVTISARRSSFTRRRETILGVAVMAAHRGAFGRAAQLAGAAEACKVGARTDDEDLMWTGLLERLEPATARLDRREWESAWSDGIALSIEDAAALAIAEAALAATK